VIEARAILPLLRCRFQPTVGNPQFALRVFRQLIRYAECAFEVKASDLVIELPFPARLKFQQ
jgi:hypothetical protein